MLRKLPEKDIISWGEFIGKYCEFCHAKTIVEIGVQHGKTTLYLCEVAKKTNGKVFGYDYFPTKKDRIPDQTGWPGDSAIYPIEQAESNLRKAGFDKDVFQLTKVDTRTPEFEDILKEDTKGNIDVAFIDGCHSYKGVKNDFLKIYPHIASDGSIIFHDTFSHSGPRNFITDLYTNLNDGEYDIINLPYGYGNRRIGLTILVKRSYPGNKGITNQAHDNGLKAKDVYQREKNWFNEDKKKKLDQQKD